MLQLSSRASTLVASSMKSIEGRMVSDCALTDGSFTSLESAYSTCRCLSLIRVTVESAVSYSP